MGTATLEGELTKRMHEEMVARGFTPTDQAPKPSGEASAEADKPKEEEETAPPSPKASQEAFSSIVDGNVKTPSAVAATAKANFKEMSKATPLPDSKVLPSPRSAAALTDRGANGSKSML